MRIVTIATHMRVFVVVTGLSLVLTGCPAFLSDGFQVVDGSAGSATSDGSISTADATAPTDGASPVDATQSASEDGCGTDCDAEGDVSQNADADAGCPDGFLACTGGCVDPSTVTNCGACDNVCGGDAALCAGVAGSFACVASCPSSTPTTCGATCVDTTSNIDNCMTCGNVCTTAIANATAICVNSQCSFDCDTDYSLCANTCVDFNTDNSNCGGCGATYACANGSACVSGSCEVSASQTDAAVDAGPVPCPVGGCPTSTASGFACPTLGHCNGTTSECSTVGGCFCSSDSQCLSAKCVKVTGENDVSCGGGGCSGSGSRDGFNCELASPGIPVPTGSAFGCPANSGYHDSQLSCDPTHTNCYCTADTQCPSDKCIPSTNNGSCASAGPCTGSGTADYRGCQTIATLPGCPIYIGCPSNSTCTYPTCSCTSDVACTSGYCIPSADAGACVNCTGTGAGDGHGCQRAPSSVACIVTGGTSCATALTPTPVLNPAKTACLCVTDSDCSSGKCVNTGGQCTGTCTGTGTADAEGCETATSVANAWSCSAGNCNTVSTPSGMCTAAGVPCWCTSDSQCPNSTMCASWAGCSPGQCSGSGTGNAFNCVP